MPTRQPDSTHEAETRQPLPPDAPEGTIESPSRDQMQGANGPPQYSEDDANPSADQDIDTAGTDMDEQSPTKAMGTGIAGSANRG